MIDAPAVLERRLEGLLASHPTLKLATVGHGDMPWITAAFFTEDGPYQLLLMLDAGGRTLANLQANPDVAVMIESGDPTTLFAQAEARAEIMDERCGATFRDALIAKTPACATVVALPRLVPVRVHVDRWRITDARSGGVPARDLVRRRPSARTADAMLEHLGR